MALYIRLENVPQDKQSNEFGPFEYAQLTYQELHVDGGIALAFLDLEGQGCWRILDVDLANLHRYGVRREDTEMKWTDVNIFTK